MMQEVMPFLKVLRYFKEHADHGHEEAAHDGHGGGNEKEGGGHGNGHDAHGGQGDAHGGHEEHGHGSIDFKKISKELADVEQRQYINQIGPHVTDVFLQHSRYVDEHGVMRFKSKFSKAEAEALSQDLYDALGYHSHRRVFGITEDQYKNLAQYKDPNGNSYIDAITQHHYRVDRNDFKKALADKDKDNHIDHKTIEALLKRPIEYHTSMLSQGLLSKEGANDPEQMNAVKKSIDDLVRELGIPKSQINTKKMYDWNEILGTYIQLSQRKYKNQDE